MFGVISTLVLILFVVVFLTTIAGFITHARLAGKIFKLAESEIDRRAAADTTAGVQRPDPTPSLATCEHCGSAVPAGNACPNCGATLSHRGGRS